MSVRTLFVGSGSSYVYRLNINIEDGSLTLKNKTKVTDNQSNSRPTFVTIHPNKRILYTISAIANYDGKKETGGILTYKIDDTTHDLSLIDSATSEGNGPCCILLDNKGENVLIANYHGGNFGLWKTDQQGSLSKKPTFFQQDESNVGPHKSRQDKPHAHQFIFDPSNKYAYCCDLGQDRIYQFVFDSNQNVLSPNQNALFTSTQPGAGPRHITFHPTLNVVYGVNELGNTVSTYTLKDDGTLEHSNTLSSIPEPSDETTASAVVTSPDGKFLYVSNRGGSESLAIFKIQDDGSLELVGFESSGGKCPRQFMITDDGKLLIVANQNSNDVRVFRRDVRSGKLQALSHIDGLEQPMCVSML
ncbi:6-phosphogluconolactonase [Acrasis kona]|uniref:6-phosphogluconolactonase n=1 Tax=Acrasis kona TaxID=1008807 RepID=A0AAW2Z5J9_9EUKA